MSTRGYLLRPVIRPRLRPTLNPCRFLQTSISSEAPDFAFAFDIDGVLVRSHEPIPRAHEALSYLQSQRIPFILLTNGGGKHESERVAELSDKLGVKLDIGMFVQSHTPFADLAGRYLNKTVLVVGGDEDRCRQVAERYGFTSVVTPADILVACPHIWPFSHPFLSYYKAFARPLPKPINPFDPSNALKIDAIFVYNDPRDWGLDATIILDLLLSREGILGTISSKNGNRSLPNDGYLQDGQPPLLYSNPDLWWAAKYHLPRLGQGGFREAMEGLWTAVTGGSKEGVSLKKEVIGKPFRRTYEFAEKVLRAHRHRLFNGNVKELKTVYMIGDNPDSDIKGTNAYASPHGTEWCSILVRTGVHQNNQAPSWRPKVIVDDVGDAVEWALKRSAREFAPNNPSLRKGLV